MPAGLLAGLDRLLDSQSEVEVDRTGIVARHGIATGLRVVLVVVARNRMAVAGMGFAAVVARGVLTEGGTRRWQPSVTATLCCTVEHSKFFGISADFECLSRV